VETTLIVQYAVNLLHLLRAHPPCCRFLLTTLLEGKNALSQLFLYCHVAEAREAATAVICFCIRTLLPLDDDIEENAFLFASEPTETRGTVPFPYDSHSLVFLLKPRLVDSRPQPLFLVDPSNIFEEILVPRRYQKWVEDTMEGDEIVQQIVEGKEEVLNLSLIILSRCPDLYQRYF
tara:strand:- start:379 stop:909 length:531 start_codon:yes stop_codon:yes gene_type:complete